MKLLSIIFLTLFSCHSFAGVTCGAFTKTFDANGAAQVKKKDLNLVFETVKQLRLEADIGLTHFSLLAEKKNDDFLLLITQGPNYIDGVITRGSFDSSGALNLSKVSGNSVHKVECVKTSSN